MPAPVGTGIIFLRKSAKGMIPVKVDGSKVVATQLSTTIGENGAKIQTVEHFLATLAGLKITNLIIELDSGELPIMDGSAKPFVDLILKAGTLNQNHSQPVLKITHPVEVRSGDKCIVIRPAAHFEINCTIDYHHPLLSRQTYRYQGNTEEFIQLVAPARTFGFLDEVEALRNRGLVRGGSLENAIVIGPKGVLNQEGLRYSDEFVRHKTLDLLGDLYLLGMPILGKVEAYCPGHELNTKLVSKILASVHSWTMVTDRPAAQSASSSQITAHV